MRFAKSAAWRRRMEALRQQKRAALLELFEAVDGGPFHRCKAHVLAMGTPCGRLLRMPHSGSLTAFMLHLQRFHSAEHTALMLQLSQM